MKEASSQTLAPVAVTLIGSLLLTGGVVSLFCRPPLHPTLSGQQLIALAGFYVLVAAALHALIVWTLCKVFRDQIEISTVALIYGSWISAAWLPLLVLLVREHSIWMACVPPLISAHAVAFLKQWRPRGGIQANVPLKDGDVSSLFYIQEPTPLARAILPAVVTSIAFQSGLGALLLGYRLSAGSLFSVCTVLPIWRFPVESQSDRPNRKTRSQVASLIKGIKGLLVVIVFTAIVLIPFLRKGGGSAWLSALLQTNRVNASSSPARRHSNSRAPRGAYSGVILFVPPKPAQKIMPPSPAGHPQLRRIRANPVVIPFDGVYWYFKPPDQRPEADARVVHGNPTKVNIRSADTEPLLMEARQSLGASIRMDCCSAMHVEILNADNRPGAIYLQVLLKNAGPNGSSTRSLGTVVIPSSEVRPISSFRPPIDEILTFPFPASAREKQFDEITVVVKPAKERALTGTRIAIQQFVLVPRE